ncbi:MAG: hypothetical protein CMD39_01800 [Gammaproteobacteria bacterium]|nr:hypothetical protein [Gammaproteobacteria bacterium]|tara:strand:- start:9721 stop:9954 length:234 start_codon:yes stop_codon:yes gene_type:complete
MPAEALICDEAWSGTTCPGTVSSVDLEPLMNAAEPFDWAQVDTVELAALFAAGGGVVVTMWAVAYGASVVLDVLRKS